MSPVRIARTYLYTLRHPGLFAEFYFPKRIVYQSEIVTALEDGVDELRVKKYLSGCARELLKELATYPYVLDSQRYAGRRAKTISVADIKKRVELRPDPSISMDQEKAEKEIQKIAEKVMKLSETNIDNLFFFCNWIDENRGKNNCWFWD